MIDLAAFDMDGTLVDITSSWGEVHRFFGDNNEAALAAFMGGEIDDAEFIRRDIRIWWRHRPELTSREIGEILSTAPLMPGAKALFATLKRHGVRTAIVSGGIDVLAERIGAELGVETVLANGFETTPDGRLTGEGIIRVPVLRKEEAIRRLQEKLGVPPERTLSVGNSEIDVGLFRRSRVGVAFLPADETVVAGATHVVREKDLTRVAECVGLS